MLPPPSHSPPLSLPSFSHGKRKEEWKEKEFLSLLPVYCATCSIGFLFSFERAESLNSRFAIKWMSLAFYSPEFLFCLFD